MAATDAGEAPPGPPPRLPPAGGWGLQVVRQLVDQGPVEQRLVRLVRYAAHRLGAASGQVSLVGEQDQVIAVTHGFELVDLRRSGPTADSLCTVTVAHGAPLVVTDAATHPWVAGLPPVVSGTVGSYLGVVLRDPDGAALGSLCVFDATPRTWSDEQVRELDAVGELVSAELIDHLDTGPGDVVLARLAAEAADLGRFRVDLLGAGRVEWDHRMLAMHGLTADTFDRSVQAWASRVHPADLPTVLQTLAVAGGAPGEVVCEYRARAGQQDERWVRLRGRVLPDMLGRSSRLVGVAYDASADHRREDEIVRLTETMPTALVRVGRDWTVTYVNALAERLVGRGRDELVGTGVHDAFPGLRGSDAEQVYAEAMQTGRPRTTEVHVAAAEASYEVNVWPDEHGLTLFFHDVSGRVRAQAALERANRRLEVLADAGARLARSLQPHEVLDVLGDVLVPQVADGLTLAVTARVAEVLGEPVVADTERLYPVRVRHVDRSTERELRDLIAGLVLRTDATTGLGAVVRTRTSVRMDRVPEDVMRARGRDQQEYERMARLDTGPHLVVPLTAPGGVLGAFTVSGHGGDDLDEVLVKDLAVRAAVALENALSFAGQHQAATVLQRALLPRRSPALPGVEVATRYLPASAQALAGGDFFTTVDVDGVLVCALGDVMGHGTQSAARAGQLHGLVAALALQGLGPGELLLRLAGGIDQMMDLGMATLLVCSYDPATRTLTTASAGHPPPVLVPPDGAPGYVELDPGPPLGAGTGEYDETVSALPAGCTVLLFSDGLVERREESLTDGLSRLQDAVARLSGEPEALCDGVLEALRAGAAVADDIALLALRHR